jgi:branched-subunit amino acid aminotransferase/4-amino-4-deoxychorismate lyase
MEMPVLRWSEAGRSWRSLEEESPEGLGSAEVGLYEVLLTSASAYALALHADRIARSWTLLTGRPFSAEAVPSLPEARAEVIRRRWPAFRFEVRRFADGSTVAQIRRRERPSVKPPLRLLPVDCGPAAAAYPHKSVDRRHLMEAHEQAVEAGADDALMVVGGEVREAAQAFVGLVTAEALVLPPLRQNVLPSTTRTATADWCREEGRAVIERPIRIDELAGGALIWGNALVGLVPAYAAGGPVTPLPDWFDAPAIERRLAE